MEKKINLFLKIIFFKIFYVNKMKIERSRDYILFHFSSDEKLYVKVSNKFFNIDHLYEFYISLIQSSYNTSICDQNDEKRYAFDFEDNSGSNNIYLTYLHGKCYYVISTHFDIADNEENFGIASGRIEIELDLNLLKDAIKEFLISEKYIENKLCKRKVDTNIKDVSHVMKKSKNNSPSLPDFSKLNIKK